MVEYFENILEVVDETVRSIDEKQFEKLVKHCTECVRSGGKIIATGLGKNVPICEKFVGTMNSLGLDARFLHTNTAVHGDLGMVRKNDIVLMLSKGGRTEESVKLANYLLERGTETWLIGFYDDSDLAKRLENKLIMHLRNEGDKWDIIPNNSTTVYLIVLQGLALQISDRLCVTLDEFKQNHPGGGIGAKLRGEELPH